MPCNSCIKAGLIHSKPRREKRMMSREEQCDLCERIGWDVQYCGFCKKWLCDNCRRDPVKRAVGFTKEKILRRKVGNH